MKRSKDWDALSEKALIRRRQAKWKIDKVSLLAAARDRAEGRASADWLQILDIANRINDPQDWPIVKAIGDLQASWKRLSGAFTSEVRAVL